MLQKASIVIKDCMLCNSYDSLFPLVKNIDRCLNRISIVTSAIDNDNNTDNNNNMDNNNDDDDESMCTMKGSRNISTNEHNNVNDVNDVNDDNDDRDEDDKDLKLGNK